MATSKGRERLDALGRQFAYCDEIAIGVAIDPEEIIVTEKLIRGTVELNGTYTRGQVVLAWVEDINETESPMSDLRFVTHYSTETLDKLIHDTIQNCSVKEYEE